MNNNTLYIANRKRVYERFIQLIIFLTGILIIFNLIRFYVNPNFKFSYASIVGYFTAIIWIALTEVSITKLEFDNEKKELIINKKSFFGKERNYTVKYSKLEYQVKSLNKFWGYIFWKKRLTLFNDTIEVAKVISSEEFNVKEIAMIEKTILEIKNANW